MIYGILKRAFDFLFALLILIVLSPIFLVVAIMFKRDSVGPVFYQGQRTGRNGAPFFMYKFRTMVPDADLKGGPSTALRDPRLTKIGRKLRKTKLDELPQLFNIVKGEMSFVGPRPQVKKYTDLYNRQEIMILSVRPGLTDFASLHFFDMDARLGECNVDKKYAEEVEPQKNLLRLEYIKKRGIKTDLSILVKTIFCIFKNCYQH